MITKYFVMQSFISQKVVYVIEAKKVTKEPNLKEIERKAYMSYHQDGLLDIFAGLYILGFGLGIFMDIVLDFGMGIIMIPGGLAVVGLGLALVFPLASFDSGSRQWLDLIFQNGMLIVGFGSLAVCILFGYSMGIKRLYAYGLLSMITLVIGHFVGIFFAYILMGLGTTVTVVGFALLITFVKKYPLKGDKAIAE
jgi:hypothetical protein